MYGNPMVVATLGLAAPPRNPSDILDGRVSKRAEQAIGQIDRCVKRHQLNHAERALLATEIRVPVKRSGYLVWNGELKYIAKGGTATAMSTGLLTSFVRAKIISDRAVVGVARQMRVALKTLQL